MTKITSFRDLLVWQKSIDLAVRCHFVARGFPRQEQAVLGYQLRKSALSMPSNVAEGFSRHSTASYIQHLWTAHASGAELESQLLVGRKIDIVSEADAEALIANAQEIGRMLNGLVSSLERGR
ncbi:MAG: four helix bundle protein [Acidimicrobiia bacterium]|nr:four helix bundle protein [Acidimicrobiia bacterium]